jgi:hypothetical protein
LVYLARYIACLNISCAKKGRVNVQSSLTPYLTTLCSGIATDIKPIPGSDLGPYLTPVILGLAGLFIVTRIMLRGRDSRDKEIRIDIKYLISIVKVENITYNAIYIYSENNLHNSIIQM